MTKGQKILNRAWNHLWLDSEDTRQLGLENIALMQCYKLAADEPWTWQIEIEHGIYHLTIRRAGKAIHKFYSRRLFALNSVRRYMRRFA